MSKKGYDFLAYFYATIERITFGKSLEKSKSCFLDNVSSSDQILVAGCGNGKALKKAKLGQWTLLDSSEKMLNQARKNTAHLNTALIQDDFFNYIPNTKYDVICLHYFLDLFDEKGVNQALAHAVDMLAEHGMIWIADFDQTKASPWQKLKLMAAILFFKLFTNLKINSVKHLMDSINLSGLEPVKKRTWKNGFIFALLLKKQKY